MVRTAAPWAVQSTAEDAEKYRSYKSYMTYRSYIPAVSFSPGLGETHSTFCIGAIILHWGTDQSDRSV
jgi:hypothetical protein